jgi:hypothetical protein
MVQFFLNGEEKELSQNIVIGDSTTFTMERQDDSFVSFQRTTQKKIFEYIRIHYDTVTTIYHWFFNTEGKIVSPSPCIYGKCKLGHIEHEEFGDQYFLYLQDLGNGYNIFNINDKQINEITNTFQSPHSFSLKL